jgi:hypothetical protein
MRILVLLFRKFKLVIAISFTLLGIAILLWFCLRGFLVEKFINPQTEISLPGAGQVGDFIGGFVGTVFAFVGLLLLYETLSLQRKEFTDSRQVFIKQQFDNSFFELLRLYNEVVNKISIKNGKETIRGREFFRVEKEKLQSAFRSQDSLSKNRRAAIKMYEDLYVEYQDITSIYFRTLFRIYSLVDKSIINEKDKAEYSKILRAQLSNSELFFIRYNAMTEQGKNSGYYINKYNYLKHLSNFDLLEFKFWWSRLDKYEKNGIGLILKDMKSVLSYLMDDDEIGEIHRTFKRGRYDLKLTTIDTDEFNIIISRDLSKNIIQREIVDGLEKFSDYEIENLLECILKELIIVSNFNMFNQRRHLCFYSETKVIGQKSIIKVGVRNKAEYPLILRYPHDYN